jgi:hypothetical protein
MKLHYNIHTIIFYKHFYFAGERRNVYDLQILMIIRTTMESQMLC